MLHWHARWRIYWRKIIFIGLKQHNGLSRLSNKQWFQHRCYHYQSSLPFTLETNASGVAIGAILSHNNHPIAYFSKKISPRMQNQSAYVSELFVVTEAVTKFWHYLLWHQFTIRTDQQALRHICQQTIQTPKQQRWLPKLLGFDFVIEYKLSKDNVAADALSRCFALTSSQTQASFLTELQSLQRQDQTYGPIIATYRNQALTILSILFGKVFYVGRVVWWYSMNIQWSKDYWKTFTILFSEAIQDLFAHTCAWLLNSFGKECARMFMIMVKTIWSVSKLNPSPQLPRDY